MSDVLLSTFFEIILPAIGNGQRRAARAMRRTLTGLPRRWRRGPFWYRSYLNGHAIMLIWWFSYAYTQGEPWLFGLLCLAIGAYCAGFISWSTPAIKTLVGSWWGKWLFAIVHAFLLIFSVVVARGVVWEALQMPPQYFDLTVSFVALVAYVPVVICSGMAVMLTLFTSGCIVAFCGRLSAQMLQDFAAPLLLHPAFLKRFARRLERFSNRAMAHTFGIVCSAMLLALLLDGISAVSRHAQSSVRWFALFADFHPAGSYPGVPCHGRIRLQDNGVVVVADTAGNDVVFRFTRFDEKSKTGCLSD